MVRFALLHSVRRAERLELYYKRERAKIEVQTARNSPARAFANLPKSKMLCAFWRARARKIPPPAGNAKEGTGAVQGVFARSGSKNDSSKQRSARCFCGRTGCVLQLFVALGDLFDQRRALGGL